MENLESKCTCNPIKQGDKVISSYRGSVRKYPGTIKVENGDTFDIDFDDGDKQKEVKREALYRRSCTECDKKYLD